MYVCFWILFLQKSSDFLNIRQMFGVVKYQGSLCSLSFLCIFMHYGTESGEWGIMKNNSDKGVPKLNDVTVILDTV